MEGRESAKGQGYGDGELGTEVHCFTEDPIYMVSVGAELIVITVIIVTDIYCLLLCLPCRISSLWEELTDVKDW